MVGKLEDRCCAAVLGATVADAAAQPIHWNYNATKLKEILDKYGYPEFVEPSHNPFYCIKTGKQSCYGDQAYVVLKSLVFNRGLNADAMKQSFYEFFGPGSDYDQEAVNKYIPKTAISGTKKFPVNGPWKNMSIKDFLKNMEEGLKQPGSETDCQIDAITKIAPVVALYAGKRDMLEKVEEVIRVTQNDDIPVACALTAARILEHFVLNGKDPNVFEKVKKDLRDPDRENPTDLDNGMISHINKVDTNRSKDHTEAATQFGLPGAFLSALHGLMTSTDYVEGVRATLRAGGCNASRASFIGMCMAGQEGIGAIPEDWKKKTIRYKEVAKLCQELMKIRSEL